MEPEAIKPQEKTAAGEKPDAGPAPGDEIAGLKGEIADLKDRLLRSVAEAENIRKRAERERQETARYAIVAFARDLVSVADNLGRALQAVPQEARENDAVRTLMTGVELTERELQSAFERHAVRKIVPKGEPFNAHFHQAVAEVPSKDVPSGHVLEVIQPGYAIDERLVRAAMVVVAKAQAGEAAAAGSQVDTSA